MTYQAEPGHLFSSPRIKLRREWGQLAVSIRNDEAGAGGRGIRAEGWKLVGGPAILGGGGTSRPIYRFGNLPSTRDTLRRVHPGGIAKGCEPAAISAE